MKNKKASLFYLYLIGVFLVLNGCEKEDDTYAGYTDTEKTNHWIEETLRDNYLWNNEIPDAKKLNYSNAPEDFLTSLLSDKDGKARSDGSHHYFSRIEKTKPSSRVADADNSYGFEYVFYPVKDKANVYARVLYVLPGSPASECGLKRGDWITAVNGQDITSSSDKLSQGEQAVLTIAEPAGITEDGIYKLEKKGDFTIRPSRKVDDNPILKDTIYHIGGKQIGYLCYTQFNSGPQGYEDHTYEDRLKEVFARFESRHINELIIDLRYNIGGYTSTLQIAGSMMVPKKYLNDIFQIEEDNRGNKKEMRFVKSLPNPDLSRVYMLTGSNTASAAEALINGLSPYMEVVMIGSTTTGKNVGSTLFRSKEFGWDLWPITFKIYNSRMESDYGNGFPLNKFRVYANELTLSINDSFIELGDTDEYLLRAALEVMGVHPDQTAPKQGTGEEPSYASSLQKKKAFGQMLQEARIHNE